MMTIIIEDAHFTDSKTLNELVTSLTKYTNTMIILKNIHIKDK